ncbi:HAMP domain-containing sensor histidine kinase [Olivibacter ginsenosidimutans]|uniref:histidine kinase n=1 Tax=Olivibacter ginsenosidimutans TaxID=1176537 RepID=A0ABP9AIG4_9SPHI
MNTSLKIRILLLVLTLCFIGTAITINLTFRKDELLRLEAKRIEQNLHKKELFVKSFLADTNNFNALRDIQNDEELTQKIVEYLGEQKQIYVYTYSNSELTFWGSDRIVPQSDAGLPEGSSWITPDNGSYEAIKKSKGGFSVVCLIPIKAKYALKNDYLSEKFSSDLIHSQNLTIANYDDNPVYSIRSVDGKYLFSVKLKKQTYNTLFSKLELAMWLAAVLFATVLMNSFCVWLADRGKVKLSALLFLLFFATARYIDLQTGWLANHFFNEFFDPKYYASNFLFPSLGAFLLNIIAAVWFTCYVYNYRFQLFKVNPRLNTKIIHIGFFVLASLFIYIASTQIVQVFGGLIGNSNIQFNVSNILKLNIFSWIGILSLCLVILNLYLLLEIVFAVGSSLTINKRQWLLLFAITFIAYATFQFFFNELTASFFIFAAIILLRAISFYNNYQFNLVVFITSLLLFACIASLKQTEFIQDKELESQKLILQRLESADDPDAVFIFYGIENNVAKDYYLINYFSHPERYKVAVLNDYLRQTYFSGYLSRYEFNIFELTKNYPDDVKSVQKLSYYKQKVESGSIKVSEYFYRINNSLGNLLYFGLIPIIADGKEIGTAVIELSSKAFERYASFPEILSNGRVNQQDDLQQYSFALYRNGKLINQFGDHRFSISDQMYPKNLFQYIHIRNQEGGRELMYRPNEHVLMVLSKDGQGFWVQLASLSFLFLVLLVFAIVVYALRWLIVTFKNYDFSFRNVRRSFLITQNKILYRTRIQAFVVLAVVLNLIVSGIITFFSISNQYQNQQEVNTVRRINQLASGFESTIFKNKTAEKLEIEEDFLHNIANINATDISLYNTEGLLFFTTQSKIYDLGLTSRYMNANAWLNMARFQRSEYFHKEKIGDLSYTVAYAPIKNEQDETIAYLSLPYFSNEKDFSDRIGMLLNTLINIYALVIVALGLFAVFIANRITSPLILIQRSLAKTSIGKINEPLFWKRNDEIGSLIKEYNNMIAALEVSANKIAQSERESAWREMAKQVAHEIKNPLTPLKLGVQLLERSWKEHDPNFDQKFKRFSKSFIEQIDSLSTIASEFSNFAKMPDTQLEDVDLLDIIEKIIPIYNNNAAVDIFFKYVSDGPVIARGDRDQLRRSFSNLIKNAIEAKAGRGKCIIKISLMVEDHQASIAIRDNGNGIDEGVRDRIFQPNFTTKSSGTGLGLAFVKQTIESMQGTIYYNTEIGQGTTFYIKIPIKKEK